MDLWKPEDYNPMANDPEMMTSQECLQLKRDLEENMDHWSQEDYISMVNEFKMMTSQQCLQIKRNLETADDRSDFEVSSLTLGIMMTFMLLGIGFWIWLISWNCFFDQTLENSKGKKDRCDRLAGGRGNRSKNKEDSSTDGSDERVKTRLLKNCHGITGHLIPDYIAIPGSSRQAEPTSSSEQTSPITGRSNAQLCHEAESPTTDDTTTASSLEKKSPRPTSASNLEETTSNKYKKKWTKFLRFARKYDKSDN